MNSATGHTIPVHERLIYQGLFALLYVYLWIRAITVPLVHDEIATFYHYIQTGRFLPYLSHWDANNHFLNSALSWLSYQVFGLSELSLRLPNLLAVPLLFWAVYQVAGEMKNRWIRGLWIVTLLLNHFFIEYSALSRGYGMSMAFLMAALWYTIRILQHNQLRHYMLFSGMVVGMLLSNLTLIYSVLILLMIVSLITIIRNHEKLLAFFSRMTLLIFAGYLPLGLAIQYLLALKEQELLYYGIEGGFWKVTVASLTFHSIGSESRMGLILVVVILLFIIFSFFKAVSKSHKLEDILTREFLFYYLLFGNTALFITLHYILGIKYPEDRVGMFFIPFFLGSFYFGLDRLIQQLDKKYWLALAIPLLILPVNFIRSANLSHTTYWKNMGISQDFYNKIKASYEPGTMPPVVGGHWLRSYFWAMEDYRDLGRLNLMHHADTTELTDDYLIYNMHQNPEWKLLYDSMDYDPVRDIHLLQRKQKCDRRLVGTKHNINTYDTIDYTYFLLMEGRLDTLAGKDLFWGWDMTLYSPDKPFRGAVVLDVSDISGNQLYYYVYKLYHQRIAWLGKPGNALNGIKVSKLPEGSHQFKLYLWNQENQDFLINNGTIMISRLDP
jgi:hypothetical protein